jgi:hypothetical protein
LSLDQAFITKNRLFLEVLQIAVALALADATEFERRWHGDFTDDSLADRFLKDSTQELEQKATTSSFG